MKQPQNTKTQATTKRHIMTNKTHKTSTNTHKTWAKTHKLIKNNKPR